VPSHAQSRTFTASIQQVREAAHDALLSLGSEVTESEDGNVLSGKTGWTTFSFGETVEITLEPSDGAVTAEVESRQRMKVALLDLGHRNRRNVGAVLNAMASRLATT
jgi:hypothetical protein